MSHNVIFLILGMALVTYIPRALPVLFIDKINLNPKVEKFLRLIPYTAMSALIFPGVVFIDPDHLYIGIIGGIVAGVLACKKAPLMVCVLAAIAVDFLLYWLIV